MKLMLLQLSGFCAIGMLALVAAEHDLKPDRAGEDWPQFLGPTGKGISSETGLMNGWPAEGPPMVWSKSVGTGYSAPSIQNGRLVLHHRPKDDEVVECFDSQTGASIWRYSYPSQFVDPYGYNSGPRCTPLLNGDRCYTFGAEGKLLCLELSTGKLIWERDTSKEWHVPEAFFGVGSTPILESGLLLVMLGAQPNSGVVAFDPETGKTVWESVGKENWDGVPKRGWPGEPPMRWRSSEKQASYATPVAGNIHGQRLVFCLMRQGLVALEPRSGDIRFSYWFQSRINESVNASNPVLVGDQIFISAAYYGIGSRLLKVLPSLDAVEEVWSDAVLELHWMTPIYHEGYLYAFSGRNEPDARFRCVELQSGKLMWDRDEGWRAYSRTPKLTYGRGSCILADGKLIVLGETGLFGMFELNAREPVELARHKVASLQYPCWTAPVLARKRVYLRSENTLVCYDLAEASSEKD